MTGAEGRTAKFAKIAKVGPVIPSGVEESFGHCQLQTDAESPLR
jgi:hypothetical protein